MSISRAFLEFVKQSKPETCDGTATPNSDNSMELLNSQFDDSAMDLHEKLQHWDSAMQGKSVWHAGLDMQF